jgi:hypothetical protein
LRKDTAHGAKALRDRRVPEWTAVRATLDDPSWPNRPEAPAAGEADYVRQAAHLMLAYLTALSDALDANRSAPG